MRLRKCAHTSSVAPAAIFFLYGAFALIAQLLCFQELLIVFLGNELYLGFSLSAWMGWVGVGSFFAHRAPTARLGLSIGFLMPLFIANLFLIRLSKCLFGFGMLVGLLPMLLLTVVLLAPIGLLVGLAFSWACEWCKNRYGFSLGNAYLWDAIGTAFGGILYCWLIAGRVLPESAIVILALVSSALAILITKKRILIVSAAIALSLLLAASPLPRATRQLQWRGYSLIAERHSRYGHLVLAKTGSLISLFENGVIASHFPDPPAYEELVHWPLLAHPSPSRVLIIGGAATGSLLEILKHPVTRVDYIELDPAVIQVLRPALGAADRKALDDPRIRIIHRDARRFLATAQEHYDVILLQLPAPMNAQINRLYTIEAFQKIRQRLAPSGLFAFTIPSSENYLSSETAYFNASLYQTLKAAFASVELVAGDPLLLLAGLDEPHLELPDLIQRYGERSLRTQEVVPAYMPIKLDAHRRAALLSQLTAARLAVLNRDFVPVSYAVAFRAWLSKFVSPSYFLGALALIAIMVFLLQAAWRRRRAIAHMPGPAALFFLGFAGMVYETVLLLAFQSLNGYVYWQLGALFAAFMLGLALGSWLSTHPLSNLAGHLAFRGLRVLLLVTALEGLLLVWILPAFQRFPVMLPWLVPFCLLLLLTGLWLGLAFPLASHLSAPEDVARTAGRLYAADLWGAALGAAFTSAFFVPLIGLLATVGLMGLMLLFAAWLLPGPSTVNPHSLPAP